MANVHIASAANEVAQALPSTATVTVSKHGIQAVETLRLPTQTETQSQWTWSRTFSGMEILTNPSVDYRVKTDIVIKTMDGTTNYDGKITEEMYHIVKKMARPTSDPISTASSNITVTVNNASMSLQPSRDTRLITTAYPDEAEPHNQRKHYGLNQLDKYADQAFCDYNQLAVDDTEEQLNNNALRETYPTRVFCNVGANSVLPRRFVSCVTVTGALASGAAAGNANDVTVQDVEDVNGVVLGKIVLTKINGGTDGLPALGSAQIFSDATRGGVDAVTVTDYADLPDGTYSVDGNDVKVSTLAVSDFAAANTTLTRAEALAHQNFIINQGAANDITGFTVYHDICQPLSHPYFRDNAMRDNTLVNVRYFDCTVNFNASQFVEVANRAELNKFGVQITTATRSLHYDNVAADGLTMDALKPHLSLDLVTPSVPLPTISDKVISTYHTMVSPAEPGELDDKQLKSANIQLAQVPDRIYVFARSDKMLSTDALTRLGVCTRINVRTPQNSGFLSQMSQDEIYQMSCRNGSKQPRSSFMCTLGSIVCIDPEKDLGGYTNGVLVPFTFDVQGQFESPCKTGGKSKVWLSDLQVRERNRRIVDPNESWSLVVVCELQGHLYLMSDGTGKQTKSNLTVTEVADAIAEGIHHPTTFAAKRVSKMDSGVLGEVARATGTAGDDVRQILRE